MSAGRAPAPTGTLDTTLLRRAFGTFATGVTVVTVGGEDPHGMTANSFSSVSLDPPLLLVSVGRVAAMHDRLAEEPTFGISILAAGQERLGRYFANPLRPAGTAQFDSVDWTPGPRTGVPLLVGALATFECEQWQMYDGGDHTIVVGRLLDVAVDTADPGEEPLMFHRGRFLSSVPQPTRLAA